MFYTAGGGHVEDFRRRGRGAGFDYAVCRDDRGLGTAYPAILRGHPARLGEKPDSARQECVGRGLIGYEAAPLRARVGPALTIAPFPRCRKPLSRPCPAPDSSIFTFTRPIHC